MNQVVSQHHYMKIRYVGQPAAGGNLAQRQIVEQLANGFLDRCSRGIEAPDPPGGKFQVGDQHFVGVAPVLEQLELSSLFHLLGQRTANDDKAPSFGPVVGTKEKLASLPAVPDLAKSHGHRTATDRAVLLGDDSIAATPFFQRS